jgi:hypothetical protein
MYLIKAYFILGPAMCLVVLWDHKCLPGAAGRVVKQPGDKPRFSPGRHGGYLLS